ncbi:MAG: hypothetical protein KAS32_24635 [Candidatus Peribacteraceae bacterium]|nr:hypothetical protein [Candidatus Peribacteraceae bacterium]
MTMEFMYDIESHDVEHILEIIRGGGELRSNSYMGGAYLKYDDGEGCGDQWTYIPDNVLSEVNRCVLG